MNTLTQFQPKALGLARLRKVAETCRRFLGIVRLTPEQRKLIADMERDYERLLRRQIIGRDDGIAKEWSSAPLLKPDSGRTAGG